MPDDCDDVERLERVLGHRPRITTRSIRFRTLGCYPLTGAVESTSTTTEDIIRETLDSRFSERQGRVIDNDDEGGMEDKKREGYFCAIGAARYGCWMARLERKIPPIVSLIEVRLSKEMTSLPCRTNPN